MYSSKWAVLAGFISNITTLGNFPAFIVSY